MTSLIPSNNLPIYFQKYTVSFLPPGDGSVSWSLVSANPSNRPYYRVWSFQLNGILRYTTNKQYMIEYNLDDVQTDGYVISFEGVPIGSIIVSKKSFVINAKTLQFTYEDTPTRKRIQLLFDANLVFVKPGREKPFLLNFYLNDASRSNNIMLAWPIFQYLDLPNQYHAQISTTGIRFAIPADVQYVVDKQGNKKSPLLLQLQAVSAYIQYEATVFSQMKLPPNLNDYITQNVVAIPTNDESKSCTYIQGMDQPLPSCTAPDWYTQPISQEAAYTAEILLSYNIMNKVQFIIGNDAAVSEYEWLVNNLSQFDIVSSFTVFGNLLTGGSNHIIEIMNTLVNEAKPYFNSNGNYAPESLCNVYLSPSFITVSSSTLDPPITSYTTQPNTMSNNPYEGLNEYAGRNANGKPESLFLIPKYQIGTCYNIDTFGTITFFFNRVTPDITALIEYIIGVLSYDPFKSSSSAGTSQAVMIASQFGGRLQQLLNKKVPLHKILYYYANVFKYQGFKFITQKINDPVIEDPTCVFSTAKDVNQYKDQIWNPFTGLGSFTNFDSFWTPKMQNFDAVCVLYSYSSTSPPDGQLLFHYVLSSTIVLEGLNYVSFFPTNISQTCISKPSDTITLSSNTAKPVLAPTNVFSSLVLSTTSDTLETIKKGQSVIVWCPILQLALAIDNTTNSVILKVKNLNDPTQQWKINVFYENPATTLMTLFDFITLESVSQMGSFLVLNGDGSIGISLLPQPDTSGMKWCVEPWYPIDVPQNDVTQAQPTNVSPSYMVSILNNDSTTILTTNDSDIPIMSPLSPNVPPPVPEWLIVPILTTDFTLKVNYDDRYYCLYNTKKYTFLCLDPQTLKYTLQSITPTNSFQVEKSIGLRLTFQLQTFASSFARLNPLVSDQPNDLFPNVKIHRAKSIPEQGRVLTIIYTNRHFSCNAHVCFSFQYSLCLRTTRYLIIYKCLVYYMVDAS